MPTFPDTSDSPHEDDIEWSAEKGIFRGFQDGTFKPNNPLTRGQAATILRRTTRLIAPALAERPGVPEPDPPTTPDEPPSIPWYTIQINRAENLRLEERGPRIAVTAISRKLVVDRPMADVVVRGFEGRGVQGAGGRLEYALIEHCGRLVNHDERQRDPAVHMTTANDQGFILRRSIVRHSPIQGIATGGGWSGQSHQLISCELTDNDQSNHTFTGKIPGSTQKGVAVAAGAKMFNQIGGGAESLWVHHEQGAGLWYDGHSTREPVVQWGLYEHIGGPAVFFELGRGHQLYDAVFLNNDREAVLVEAQGVLIDGIAVVGPSGVRGRNGNRNVGVGVKVRNSYFKLQGGMYGWEGPGSGPVSFDSDFNTFEINPSERMFKAQGEPNMNWDQWQAFGQDQNSTLIPV